jgi:hypothetical protein
MKIKGTLILIITVLTIILVFIFEFFQFKDIENIQNKEVDEVLKDITVEFKKGVLKDSTIQSFKSNLFFVIWVKDKTDNWIPVVYDKEQFKNTTSDPQKIQHNLSYVTRTYIKNVDGFNFFVWTNKYNYEFYIKNLFIPFLFILLIYLFVVLIINLLFSSQEKEFTEEKMGEYSENNYSEPDTDVISEENPENIFVKTEENETPESIEIDKDKVLSDYKDLWLKNFKISDDFKNYFPFQRIFNLLKIGIRPETYIQESLLIAAEYFEWKNPKIYINQDDVFIDPTSNDIVSQTGIEIPLKGDKKGQVYIPLFPYNSTNIFGYLYFFWDKDEPFYIADILFFLKYFFSEDAKSIFLDYKKHEYIIDILKTKMDRKGNDVFVAIISPDNREKLNTELKAGLKEKINKDIMDQLYADFKKYYIFKVKNFYFGIIGEKFDKSNEIENLEKWISDEQKHNYELSKESGNIALSFSVGMSFKGNREISPVTLINEAENYLIAARENGGNQIVAD